MLISQPLQHRARKRGSIPTAVLSLVLGAVAMGAVGSSAASAQGQATGDSLVSLMHGKCIHAEDVAGAASMPRVLMISCSPTNTNQRWTYSPATGEFKTPGNKCLDAYAMERLDPVIAYPCTGGKSQSWGIDSRGRIVMREAGPSGQRYCVTIANGDRSDGARLWLQTCHLGENQLFRRDPSGMGGSTVSIESDLRSPDPDPACVDVPARELGAVPGLQAWLWDCQGTEHVNQRWQRTAEMEFRLTETVRHPPVMCLGGGSGTKRSPVTIERCDGGASQKWNLGANGEIQLQDSQKRCLHASGESNANGNKLVLEDCAPVVVIGQRWSYRDPR